MLAHASCSLNPRLYGDGARTTLVRIVARLGGPERRSVLVLSGMDGAPLAAEAIAGDAVWDVLVDAGVTP